MFETRILLEETVYRNFKNMRTQSNKSLLAIVCVGFSRSDDAIEERSRHLRRIRVCTFGGESVTQGALVEPEMVAVFRLHKYYVRVGCDFRYVHIIPDATLEMKSVYTIFQHIWLCSILH